MDSNGQRQRLNRTPRRFEARARVVGRPARPGLGGAVVRTCGAASASARLERMRCWPRSPVRGGAPASLTLLARAPSDRRSAPARRARARPHRALTPPAHTRDRGAPIASPDHLRATRPEPRPARGSACAARSSASRRLNRYTSRGAPPTLGQRGASAGCARRFSGGAARAQSCRGAREQPLRAAAACLGGRLGHGLARDGAAAEPRPRRTASWPPGPAGHRPSPRRRARAAP